MPHVKRKRIRGNEYYYLVHNYRQSGKVKTRTLEYLGKKPPSAETLARLREKHSKPGTQLTLTLTSPDSGAGGREETTGRQS
jgi:hypothetical protein